MKKIITFFLSGIIVVSMLTASFISVHAEGTDAVPQGTVVSETTEYLPDGSSVTTIVVDETTVATRASAYTKTGSKYSIFRNKDGAELLRLTVNGTFSVNSGVSATCTNVSHSVKITDTAWQNESASSRKSGNQAIASGKFIRKMLFITVDTQEVTVTLTCDKNGNLS